ncbi:hypothetical protein M9H77_22229 [Catharanthus roseus]|uniref:Uncharacterized protein n=1 Tax=Catharanthus roseus TaxID=4058 RepID=A0ACC0AQA0_CATRO|nr:hypothetical protein M9H77_22229 [Catharanthus roseus]
MTTYSSSIQGTWENRMSRQKTDTTNLKTGRPFFKTGQLISVKERNKDIRKPKTDEDDRNNLISHSRFSPSQATQARSQPRITTNGGSNRRNSQRTGSNRGIRNCREEKEERKERKLHTELLVALPVSNRKDESIYRVPKVDIFRTEQPSGRIVNLEDLFKDQQPSHLGKTQKEIGLLPARPARHLGLKINKLILFGL